MYELIYSKQAKKFLNKSSANIQKRIISVIERSRIRPYPHVKKVVGSKYYSLRSGDYRIILDIVDDKLVILIIKIDHRKKVYKKTIS
jgi:mRNA interferase RelE/StbE